MIQRADIETAIGAAGAVTEEGLRAFLRSVCREHDGEFYEVRDGIIGVAHGAHQALTGHRIPRLMDYPPKPRTNQTQMAHDPVAADMLGGDRGRLNEPGVVKYVPAFDEFAGIDLVARCPVEGKPIEKGHLVKYEAELARTQVPRFVLFANAAMRVVDYYDGVGNAWLTVAGGNYLPLKNASYSFVRDTEFGLVANYSSLFLARHVGALCLNISGLVKMANTATLGGAPFPGYNAVVSMVLHVLTHLLDGAPPVNAPERITAYTEWAGEVQVEPLHPIAVTLNPAHLKQLPDPAALLPAAVPLVDVTADTASEFIKANINNYEREEKQAAVDRWAVEETEFRALLATAIAKREAAELDLAKVVDTSNRDIYAEIEKAKSAGLLESAKLTAYGLLLKLPPLQQLRTRAVGMYAAGVYTKPAPLVVVPWSEGKLHAQSTQIYTHDGFRYPIVHACYYGAGRACFGHTGAEYTTTVLARALSRNIGDFVRAVTAYLYSSEYAAWEQGAEYAPLPPPKRVRVRKPKLKLVVDNTVTGQQITTEVPVDYDLEDGPEF